MKSVRIIKFLGAVTVAATALVSTQANASTWSGGSADWASNVSPGWNGTGVPNAVGAVAEFNTIAAATTTIQQNVPGTVTVGSLLFGGSNNFAWTHTLTNPIVFNQDSAGAGFATISNSNTNSGTGNALILSAGTITLADDLVITNTGSSTNTTGAIQIIGTVGGTGNVTLNNASTALVQAGSIRFQTGVNTFTGNVLVRKGTTTFNTATSYGASTNVITLGESGQGAAALLSTTSITMANPIVVAAGASGSLTLGTVSTSAFTAYSGAITLNGNVDVTSGSTTNAMTISSLISGAGGINKVGTGFTSLSNTANDYSGDTVVSGGTLQSANSIPDGFGKGDLNLANSGVTWVMSGNETLNGLFGATGTTIRSSSTTAGRTLTVGADNSNSAFSGVVNNNGTAVITVAKTGTGIFTLNGNTASTSTGTLRPQYNGGTIQLDFANFAGSSDLMNAGMTLGAYGGTFELVGKNTGTTSQAFTGLSISQGSLNFGADTTLLVSPNNGTSTTLTITNGAVSRHIGNNLNFAVGTGTGSAIFNFAATNTNGIIGGFAVFNGNTWAVGGTPLTGLDSSAYSKTSVLGTSSASYNALIDVASNVDVDFVASIGTPSLILDGGITVNSLRFNTAQTQNVELALQGTNQLNSGGLLVTSAVGNHALKISGGTLAGSGGGVANSNGSVASVADLIVQQRNTANILEISSTIVDGTAGATALTKAGDGTLKLSVNNTYSGSTYVTNGTLLIGSQNAVPHGGGRGNVLVAGTLDVNNNSITVNGLEMRPSGVLRTGVAGSVTVSAGENNDAVTLNAGTTIEDGAGTLTLEKIGSGTMTSAAQVTYSGGTRLTGGTLSLGANSTPTAGVVTSGPVGRGVLTLGSGTTLTSSLAVTLANGVKSDGTATINAASGVITLSGPFTSTNAADVLDIGSGTSGVSISGDLSGFQGTFTRDSADSSLTFAANNVDLSNGKIVMTGVTSQPGLGRYLRFGDSSAGTTANMKVGDLSGTGGVVNPTAGGLATLNLEVGSANLDTEFAGAILGRATQTFNLTKVGTGSWTLSGPSSYGGNDVPGSTTISAGKLIVGGNAPTVVLTNSPFSTSAGSPNLTTPVPHSLAVNDKISFQGTLAGGLASVTTYYVVEVVDATNVKIATSEGGTPISFTAAQNPLVSQTVAQLTPLGASNTSIKMGNAATGSNNTALLTGGAFTIERPVDVTSNGSGTVTLGGNTPDISTFSGPISLAKNVKLTSATGGTVNVTGAISGSGFGVTKVGSGLATLSGANTYTGDTVVQEGTLSLTNALLANTANVFLTTGSILDLAFVGMDSINGLFIDNAAQLTGTWGAIGSSATHQSALITGTGILQVTPAGLPGDYNGDNKVDSADYVLWRKNPAAYLGDPLGYTTWRANFGNPPGSGSSLGSNAAVPEPIAFVLAAVGIALAACRRNGNCR